MGGKSENLLILGKPMSKGTMSVNQGLSTYYVLPHSVSSSSPDACEVWGPVAPAQKLGCRNYPIGEQETDESGSEKLNLGTRGPGERKRRLGSAASWRPKRLGRLVGVARLGAGFR